MVGQELCLWPRSKSRVCLLRTNYSIGTVSDALFIILLDIYRGTRSKIVTTVIAGIAEYAHIYTECGGRLQICPLTVTPLTVTPNRQQKHRNEKNQEVVEMQWWKRPVSNGFVKKGIRNLTFHN